MLKLFKKFWKFLNTEGHAAVDKIQDPIKTTENAIRELRENYEQALQSKAEIIAHQIRSQKENDKAKQNLAEWQRKYKQLTDTNAQPELIKSTAVRIKSLQNNLSVTEKNCLIQTNNVAAIQKTTDDLWAKIKKYEDDLKILRTRHVTAKATLKIQKELSGINADGAISLLEDMKLKVEKEEALALEYCGMNEDKLALEVDKALNVDDQPLLIDEIDEPLKLVAK